MVYSFMKFYKKQDQSACIMSKAIKVKKGRCKGGNTVFKT